MTTFTLYRIEGRHYSDGSTYIDTRKFPVIRETPKGYWILDYGCRERFVLKTGRKRFAYEDKTLALDSFIRRKQVQLSYEKQRYQNTKAILRYFENGGLVDALWGFNRQNFLDEHEDVEELNDSVGKVSG